jgi:phosphohistidine phosphatase
MGEEVKQLGLTYDLVLASPAQRAAETIELVGQSPRFEDRIYDASTGALLALVQKTHDQVDRLMLVGHNPGFERLAGQLSGSSVDFPAGALVEIELPIDHWRDAGATIGTLVRFISPKELD